VTTKPSPKETGPAEYSVPPRNRQGNRTGYTTGSNAAAAAKAATIALLTGAWPETVTVTLPIGETATMRPVECELAEESAYCCMVKDAGDDPDVTHGALICARVSHNATPTISLAGGEGVGRVTLPGLGLEVGGPAINPVPHQQILDNIGDGVQEAVPQQADYLDRHGLNVVISVPAGADLARKTLNPRLGIMGGISILGTTGKVFPYSTAAWRASVIQAVEVAAKNSTDKVIMATGGRSERFAMRLFPDVPKVAFVELSVFTGDALKTCVAHRVQSAVFVGMIGKMIKTAQGHMTTHVAGNQVDFEFLAQICRDTKAPDDLADAVATANTGRHFLELCLERNLMSPVQRVVDKALEQCLDFVHAQGGQLALEVILVDFEGRILGRARGGNVGRRDGDISAAETLVERLSADPAHSYDEEGLMGRRRNEPDRTTPRVGRTSSGSGTKPAELAEPDKSEGER
jgi:cobalt-precorrin-5B (C1)-methyltransferase